MISSINHIAAVLDFLDFIEKLKGERGFSLSRNTLRSNTFTQEVYRKKNHRHIN